MIVGPSESRVLVDIPTYFVNKGWHSTIANAQTSGNYDAREDNLSLNYKYSPGKFGFRHDFL